MKAFRLQFDAVLFCVLMYHFTKKLKMSERALTFVQKNRHLVGNSTFSNHRKFNRLITEFKNKKQVEYLGEIKLKGRPIPPAFLLLNRYAVDITLNFLCNVAGFDGVHDRLVIIAFDEESQERLTAAWPKLRVLHFPLPPMQNKFSVGDGPYQLFQLFRANLCAYLCQKELEFWMIQADTYWRANLFERADPHLYMNMTTELLMDREGSDGLLADMVAGGNFFVRPTARTHGFFTQISSFITWLYTTDNNLMTAMCAFTSKERPESICAFIPYSTLSNWRWHYGDRKQLPSIMQFDGGIDSRGKLAKMRQLGAGFVKFVKANDKKTMQCVQSKVDDPARAVTKEALMGEGNDRSILQLSLTFFHSLCEYIYYMYPKFGHYTKQTLFPFYAYFIMV